MNTLAKQAPRTGGYEFRGVVPNPVTQGAAYAARALSAARRRVAVAREKAARFNTEENRLAVTELEAGLARMEAAAGQVTA
ncbi:hypothetical protein PV761_03345 [Arthrobacter sp. CC3]|uniref:hypothetical protein n=1 Tax=Arthrobacter sp. CC3 TaxID=3029185 RepID=UPI003262F6BC